MITPKLIAFYFPQFHEIEENNKWWGKGFTDWKLVKEAKPLFNGHNQPRIPLNENYYDPCNKHTLIDQANIAKKYGIEGFMFYHYWFDGKLYLEKPLEVFLDNPDIDISFCVTWANETWTRSWIGKPEVVLQKQMHINDKKIWEEHFNYLLPFFKDSRAIKIDDKPVFIIYQPFLILDSKEMLEFWNKKAQENGLKGLYYIAIKNHEFTNTDFLLSYDAIMKFQPREAYTSKYFKDYNFTTKFQFLRGLPHFIQLYLTKVYQKIRTYKIYDSNILWRIILNNAYINDFEKFKLKIFESAFFEWDNTARYKKNANIFSELSYEQKEANLKMLLEDAIKNKSPYVFFNAWNEWSECAYLEPDTKKGYENLEIIKKVIDEIKSKTKEYRN